MARNNSDKQRNALYLVRQKGMALAEQRRQDRFDDFLFLVRSGTSVEDAATRIGTNPIALMRVAYRWKRTDIIRTLGSAAHRQRYHS